MTFNEERLGEFMGTMVGHMTGGALCFSASGSATSSASTGRWPARDALSADDVASEAGCNPRLVREWLDGQVAGGLVGYDAGSDPYELSPEAAMALADDDSPVFVARGDERVRLDVHRHRQDHRRVPRRRRAELG